ncbi:MAG: hypothetical protein R3A11_02595 [Bdellovibrionota bacterium]
MNDIAQGAPDRKDDSGWVEREGWTEEWNQVKDAPEDQLERNKRYGQVRQFFDEPSYYALRVFLPKKTPSHRFVYQYGLSKTLPPYKVKATLGSPTLVAISGKLEDPSLEKLCGHVNSFPDRFSIEYPLPSEVKDIEIIYKKDDPYVVDVVAYKVGSSDSE